LKKTTTLPETNILLMDDDDYPIIYRVLTIPGGAGFCPSTVASENRPLEVWRFLLEATIFLGANC